METQSPKEAFAALIKSIRNFPIVQKIFPAGPAIAVLRLSGVISDNSSVRKSGISHAKYSPLIEKIFKLPELKAVALVINSPGGAPAQSSLIAGHIRRLADEKNIPVYAFVEDIAASGGYWLACTGDEIYAQETSMVGSVGVISSSFGLDQFIKKHDISRRIYTSGKDKNFLDPFLPENERDVKRLKEVQREIHDSFKQWVTSRRGEKLDGKDEVLFEGDFWTGAKAESMGLIDGIGEMREVIKEKFGDKVRFCDFQPDKKFLPSFLRLESSFGADFSAILETVEDRSLWSRFGL